MVRADDTAAGKSHVWLGCSKAVTSPPLPATTSYVTSADANGKPVQRLRGYGLKRIMSSAGKRRRN